MPLSFVKFVILSFVTGLGMDSVLADCCRVTSNPGSVQNNRIICSYDNGATAYDNNLVATCYDFDTRQNVGKVFLECVRGNCGDVGPGVRLSALTDARFGAILACNGDARSVWQCAGRSESPGKTAIAPCGIGQPFNVLGATIPDSAQCGSGTPP